MRRPRSVPRVPTVPTLAIAANALLIGGLVFTATEQPAPAQNGPERTGGRQIGRYTLVGGDIPMGSGNAVYIADAVNRELVSVIWDRGRNGLDPIGFRDLDADRTATPGR